MSFIVNILMTSYCIPIIELIVLNVKFFLRAIIGLVEDAKVGYKYLRKLAHGHGVFIWGHSLGSA